jgi:hypothetical protein
MHYVFGALCSKRCCEKKHGEGGFTVEKLAGSPGKREKCLEPLKVVKYSNIIKILK